MEETKKLSSYRWVILACVCGICFMANHMQYQVSAWGVVVMEGLGIEVDDLTTLMLMPMLIAVFLAIPAGGLADRFGVKRVVAVGLTVSVIAGFVRTFMIDSFPAQMVSMLGLGAGISMLNANMPKILGIWFKEKMTVAVGLFYATSCVAIVLAQSVSTLFPSLFMSYLVAAIVLTVVCICWICLVRNVPEGETLPPAEPITKYLGRAAKSKNVWFIALIYGLTLASTGGYAMILPSAFELAKGYETTLSGSLAAIITVGSFFACLIGPAWVQKRGKNKPFLIVTTIIGAAFMVVCWFVELSPALWVLLVLNGFFSACSGPIVEAMTAQLPDIGTKYAGSAGGIVTTVGIAFSYFLPIAVTKVIGDDFTTLLIVYSAIFLLSLVFIFLLPETGIKGKLQQKAEAEQQ